MVTCLGEQADGHEGDALAPIIERSRFCCPELSSVGADQGFAAERVWKAVAAAGITPYVPPQRTMLPNGEAPKTAAQREALAARERCKSERGVWAHKRRMADAEGVIGELKTEHGLGRALPGDAAHSPPAAAWLRGAQSEAPREACRRGRGGVRSAARERRSARPAGAGGAI